MSVEWCDIIIEIKVERFAKYRMVQLNTVHFIDY